MKELIILFESIKSLLDTLFDEFREAGTTLFALGLVVMGLLTAFGGEENKRNFQRGFVICLIGMMVFFLAKPLVKFVQGEL